MTFASRTSRESRAYKSRALRESHTKRIARACMSGIESGSMANPNMTQLTLLLPARDRLTAPTLARWLARGDCDAAAKPGREAQLRAHFEFHGPALPIAALTRSVDANDADIALWLRCDPAYVIADAVTLRLMACGDLQLSIDEVEEFARALKPLFGDAGFPLEASRPDRWYLRCPRETRLPKFSDPADALGDDLARHLPEGDNARQWRSLLNEAQIALTQHPLNARRAQRGLPPVNSVWFWGAGVLPQWVRCGFSSICSNDEIATTLARMAKVEAFPSPPKFSGERVQGEGGSSLLSALKSQSAPTPQPSPPTKESLGERGNRVLLDLVDQRDPTALETD